MSPRDPKDCPSRANQQGLKSCSQIGSSFLVERLSVRPLLSCEMPFDHRHT